MTTDIVQTDALSEDSALTDTPSLEQTVDQGQDVGADTATPPQADPSSLTDDTQQNPADNAEAAFDAAAAEPEAIVQDPVAALDLPPELKQVLADPRGRDRLLNLDKLYGQQSNELGQLRQQVQQYQQLGDPERIRSVLQSQEEQARISNLKPWNRGHPEHQRFQILRERRRIDDQRLSRVPPENREAVRQALEADYNPEDLQALKSYEGWRSQEDSLSPEDREDRFREIARQEAIASRQEWERSQIHQMQARAVLDKHGDILLQNTEVVERVMNPNTPRRDLAVELALAHAEIAALKGKSVKDSRQVATAQARDRLIKDQASVSRDANNRRPVDLKAAALKAAANGEDPFEVMMDLHAQAQNPHGSH